MLYEHAGQIFFVGLVVCFGVTGIWNMEVFKTEHKKLSLAISITLCADM